MLRLSERPISIPVYDMESERYDENEVPMFGCQWVPGERRWLKAYIGTTAFRVMVVEDHAFRIYEHRDRSSNVAL